MGKCMKPITYDKVFYQRNVDLGIDPECHECTSHAKDNKGYTRFSINKKKLIHRQIYIDAIGDIPECVMHLCDNPSCININHLKGGTKKENSLDMVNKCRARKAKFNNTLNEVEIKWVKMWLGLGYSRIDIAKAFNISDRLHIWRHLI